MDYDYDYSKEKDEFLKKKRGVGFSEVVKAIKTGSLLDNIDHFNKTKYPSQKIFVVRIKDYIYSVPYVIDKERKVTFLKTIYPSRKLKKLYEK